MPKNANQEQNLQRRRSVELGVYFRLWKWSRMRGAAMTRLRRMPKGGGACTTFGMRVGHGWKEWFPFSSAVGLWGEAPNFVLVLAFCLSVSRTSTGDGSLFLLGPRSSDLKPMEIKNDYINKIKNGSLALSSFLRHLSSSITFLPHLPSPCLFHFFCFVCVHGLCVRRKRPRSRMPGTVRGLKRLPFGGGCSQ